MKKKSPVKSASNTGHNGKSIFTDEYVEIDAHLKLKYTAAAIPYALTIFLGAFLLFLVEPIIGKYILPWFGGVPAVWATCLLFFQVVLLAGYCYAHFISRMLRPKMQAILHIIVLVICMIFLPIIPADGWKPLGTDLPYIRILALLAVTLGIPFLILSATGPLLQAWFTYRMPETSPYRLYALSNAGSLIALVAYPLLIEPFVTLRWQFYTWSGLFIIFALFCFWCALRNMHLKPIADEADQKTVAISGRQMLLWVALACFPSALLLATTNQLSEELSVVPVLWMGPLAIYLLSFIICFNKNSWYHRSVWLAILPLFLLAITGIITEFIPKIFLLQLSVYWGALFVICMICHGELSRLRPHPSRLTSYYLLISLGGAIGGIFVALLAPLIFRGLWEYSLSITACCLVILINYLGRRKPLPHWNYVIVIISLVIISIGAGYYIFAQRKYVITTNRSFYGLVRVDRGSHPDPILDARIMLNGRVIHGYQYTRGKLSRFPTAYFTADSGIGVVMLELQKRRDLTGRKPALRTGVVGLGVGVLAAYGMNGDYFRFYEINPDVIKLANQYFSYLSETAANNDVILGDARLSMERELAAGQKNDFDVLVLDAFTGDAIPLHLLTKEAFQLYFAHMKTDGVLALNITNDHLDLRRLILGLAQSSGRKVIHISNSRKELDCSPSDWLIITNDNLLLSSPQITQRVADWPARVTAAPLVFTDNYSNLFSLLR